MGKKKPFIDKKNSSTYHLLHRSQRDVAGEEEEGGQGGNNVLWPSPDNNRDTDRKVLIGSSAKSKGGANTTTLESWKEELSQVPGLVDDYDYEKHMKPITGTGDFFSASTQSKKVADAVANARSQDIREELTNEVERQLDSIALTADCMDDDIAELLFGDVDFEEGGFEELNDEFVLDAAKEPEEGDDDGADFDFAAHVRKLMDKAKAEREFAVHPDQLSIIHEQGLKDQEFFSQFKPSGHDDDDDSGYFDEGALEIEGTPGVVPKLSAAEEKALCDKFNETLAEYDSDDIGEGYDDDDVVGPRPLEGDAQVEAALDDYLQEREDEIFIVGAGNNNIEQGGSGFSALVGTKMVPVKELEETAPVHGAIQPIEDVLGEANEILGSGKAAPPAEEIFIDGKSYFSEKMRNPWDCESILSTYSNLDNNPITISSGGRRRKNRKKKDRNQVLEEEEEGYAQQILLSEKTGLPLGVLPTREFTGGADDTYISVNKGEARRKNETKEQKKARKLQVKKEREMARIQKKMMKEAFSQEFSKRAQEVLVDDVGGKSVFRFWKSSWL